MWIIDNSSFSPLHIEHTLFSSDTNLLLRRLLSTNFHSIFKNFHLFLNYLKILCGIGYLYFTM